MDEIYKEILRDYKETACKDIVQIIRDSFPNINTDGVEELIKEYFDVDN